MYKPCSFDRKEYLEHADKFEAVALDDAQEELTEYSDDAEGLAFELAYTRYALAKMEKSTGDLIQELKKVVGEYKSGQDPHYLMGQVDGLVEQAAKKQPTVKKCNTCGKFYPADQESCYGCN